jgi:UDP-N-acetylmuramoylalanine--D-glutamate ligase
VDFAVLIGNDDVVMRYGLPSGNAKLLVFSADKGARQRLKFDTFDEASQSRWSKADRSSVDFVGNGVTTAVPIQGAFFEGNEYAAWIRTDEIPMPGRYNVSNVQAAGLMAYAIGIDRETVARAVRGFRGVAHRMEFVADVDGVRFINNSMCTNPAAVEASVSAIETPLVAIAGGIHKGGDLTPMYASLKRNARKVVLIGAAKAEIADGLQAAGMDAGDVSSAETLPDAVNQAAALASSGDTVMLVPGCASFDMFSGFEERGAVFREAVRALEGAGG